MEVFLRPKLRASCHEVPRIEKAFVALTPDPYSLLAHTRNTIFRRGPDYQTVTSVLQLEEVFAALDRDQPRS